MPEFVSSVEIQTPRDFAFSWHQNPHAFERLCPPWEAIRLESKQGSIDSGTVVLKNRIGPFWIRMQAKHSQFVQDEQFYDEMSGGPFKSWQHWHRFSSRGEATVLEDRISYQLRFGKLAEWMGGGTVKKKLEQMFAYRRLVTKTDIEDHYRNRENGSKVIAVTGASGLVGNAVCEYLAGGGHQVIRLKRLDENNPGNHPGWDPQTGYVQFGTVDQVDSVIHLAGFGIADKRWTQKVKGRIRDSRVDPTEKLARYLGEQKLVKESFICASATGFYGDRGDEVLTEDSPRGEGFLADICEPWEKAVATANSYGIRTVNTRFGMILSAKGGALQSMLLPFKMGLGGKVGSGKQYWSWISLYDTVRAIQFAVFNENLCGPVNFTAPNPVTQREFAKILGVVLFRPTLIPMPGWAARAALGEMADYLLLQGCRVVPNKLSNCGFDFVHHNLEEALRFELGRMQL